jgi:hypothetical protein
MQIVNGSCRYEVGEAVAGAVEYRLYLCQKVGTDRGLLLQITREPAYNGGLDRAAFTLNELARKAEEVEADYAKIKKNPKSFVNYNLGFPEVVDSFVCPEQGGRRINILAFRYVDDVTQMVPLVNITDKDRMRVDLKTSAWMMGKLLKMLTFAHNEGVTIGQLGGNNILIEPERHYVVLFDWSAAQMHTGEISEQMRKTEIATAAKSVIVVLGGNPETGEIPNDGGDDFAPYTDFLLRLSRGEESEAKKAHMQFYELLSEVGWKGFHPFTTHKLGV